jgi:hypothetical protein
MYMCRGARIEPETNLCIWLIQHLVKYVATSMSTQNLISLLYLQSTLVPQPSLVRFATLTTRTCLCCINLMNHTFILILHLVS